MTTQYKSPPLQDFLKYTFTKSTSSNLEAHKTFKRFEKIPFKNIQNDEVTDEISEDISLGFKFKFCEKIYDRINISINGFFILREESDTEDLKLSDYFEIENDPWDDSELVWKKYNNTLIKSQFLSSGILFCPWFDKLKRVNGVGDQNNEYGISTPFFDVDYVNDGVRFSRSNERDGKYFSIRWKVYSTPDQTLSSTHKTVLMFETHLRQDGRIQFSYYPVLTNNSQNLSDLKTEGATVGIFVNEDGWNFRDLSDQLKHPSDVVRSKSEYGGFIYDDSYSDRSVVDGQLISTPYNSSLVPLDALAITSSDIGGATVPDSLLARVSNWPSSGNLMTMSFSPPRRTRKALPKKIVAQNFYENHLPRSTKLISHVNESLEETSYNDKKTINFNETSLNIQRPSRISRFYGDGLEGADNRQDLFLGIVTPDIAQKNSLGIVYNKEETKLTPYRDTTLIDSLNADTNFDIEIPVHHSLTMEGRRTSIYYYDSSARGFFCPDPSGYIDPEQFIDNLNVDQHKTPNDWKCFGPIGKNFATSNDSINNPELDISQVQENSTNTPWSIQNRDKFLTKKYPESVQNNPQYLPQDNHLLEVPINHPFLLERVEVEIPIEVGSGWSDDKTTTSIAIGDYSLDGKDTGYSDRCLDFSGPGITVALFNKVKNQLSSKMDLIAKGTITHHNDVDSNIAVRSTWSESLKRPDDPNKSTQVWVFEPEGFKSFGVTPGCVINTDDNGSFSGVAKVELNTNVSSGPIVTSVLTLPDPDEVDSATVNSVQRSKIAIEFCKTPKFSLPWKLDSKNYTFKSSLTTVNVYGRDESGSIVSPRQKFTFQKRESSKELREVPNPFYLGTDLSDFPKPIRDILSNDTNSDFKGIFVATTPVLNTEESKYLLMPGDKITLSISKNRPTLFGNGQFICSEFPKFRHDLEHDVRIKSGNIRIKFYGSMMKSDDKITNPSSQEFRSYSIGEEISNGLVVNQYETSPAKDFVGTYTDKYIFGNLLNFVKNAKNRSVDFVEKNYGIPLFNKENIDQDIIYPYPPADQFTSITDPIIFSLQYLINISSKQLEINESGDNSIVTEAIPENCKFLYGLSSMSKRLQPRNELAGIQRIIRLQDISERIFDSTTPRLNDVFSSGMTSVFKILDIDRMFQSNVELDFGGLGVQSTTPVNIPSKTYGTLLFDMPVQFVSNVEEPQSVDSDMINTTWNSSFPFDELYKDAQRVLNVSNFFESSKSVAFLFNDRDISKTNEKSVIEHFIPGRFLKVGDVDTFNLCVDRNMFRINFIGDDSSESTVGLDEEDLSKVMFGFGDDNTISDITLLGQTYKAGSKYQPKFRETVVESPDEDNEKNTFGTTARSYSCSPIIRGWRYGLSSGLTQFSTVVFRRGSFGQFRDILEQRTYTKNIDVTRGGKISTDPGPISISFVDYMCRTTDPLNTWAQNITFDASSTLPYFDGIPRNRPPVDVNNIDNSIIKLDI